MADDLERIQAKLNDAGVKVVCPACGSTGHTIDPDHPVGLPALAGNEMRLDRALRAITVVCTNCGFVRLHKSSYLMGE